MQVQVRHGTGEIEAVGYFPDGSPDESIDIIELQNDQVSKLQEPGTKTIGEDGTITVTPPDPADVAMPLAPPTPQAEQVDAIVAQGLAAIEAAPLVTDGEKMLAAIFSGTLTGLGQTFGTAATAPSEAPIADDEAGTRVAREQEGQKP